MGVHVKICGSTEPLAPELFEGVAYLGLNFVRASPRCLTLAKAEAIAATVPAHVGLVGVFADAAPPLVESVLAALPLRWLQFHGSETPAECRATGQPFFKAFRVRMKGEESAGAELARLVDQIAAYLNDDNAPYLVDAAVPGMLGGSGVSLDLDVATAIRERAPGRMILAGGLTPETVASAVAAVNPWAVDVASGVEVSPGIKDPSRIRAFVDAASRA